MSDVNSPLLIICFGVSGCGKSTVAEFLANKFNLHYVEADDFHSEANKAHMAAGKPLTDEMREPWITSLSEHLSSKKQMNTHCVMANSCLRKAHRQRFRALGFNTIFIHLKGDKTLITERMQARSEHFMPTSLLDSQFLALEATDNETDVVDIDIEKSITEICQQTSTIVKNANEFT